MSEIMFEKHVVGRTNKNKCQLLKELVLCPEFCRGRVKDHLPTILDMVCGKGIYISLLLDSTMQIVSNEIREDPYSSRCGSNS